MVEKRANWATMDEDERAQWLAEHVLNTPVAAPMDANLMRKCVESFTAEQRKLFVDNMLSEVAATTYKGMTREQIQSDSAREQFYFNCIMLDLENIAKCVYWTSLGERV